MADDSWRPHPFVKRVRYLVRQSFPGLNGAYFVTGETYVFTEVEYSPAGLSTIFTFTPAGGSTAYQWSWHDDDPDSLCGERFAIDEDPES